jgi:hypothetical protein
MRQRVSWGRLAALAAAGVLLLTSGSLAASRTRIPIKITIGANPAVGLAPGKSVTFVVELKAVGSSPLPKGSRLLLTFPNSVDHALIVRQDWLHCGRRSPLRGLRRYECTLNRHLYSDAGPSTPPVVAVRLEISRALAGKWLIFTAEVTSSRGGDVVVGSKEQRSVQIAGTARKPPPKPSFTGDWSYSFSFDPNRDAYRPGAGTYTFRQTGATVCGRYDFSGGGTARGTVSGRTLTGESNDKSFGRSTFTITLAADGRTWAGDWERGSLSGEWKGTKIGAASRNC